MPPRPASAAAPSAAEPPAGGSQGAIDEAAIKQLSFVTQLAKAVHIRSDGVDEADDFEAYFPHFLWVLRDFSLGVRPAAALRSGPLPFFLSAVHSTAAFDDTRCVGQRSTAPTARASARRSTWSSRCSRSEGSRRLSWLVRHKTPALSAVPLPRSSL